jgi:Helix-turn-helix of DDE superfamily endonuclease
MIYHVTMITCKTLMRKPKLFQSLTGITVQQFDLLSKKIESEYKDTEEKRLSKRKRKRDNGAGHPFKLQVKDRTLMLFMYYRMYTSYSLLGLLFGLDTANVYRDIRYIESAVKKCIPIPQKKYADAIKATTIPELERYFPEFRTFVDATEQVIHSKTKK